ncbi:hypothetical protein Y880_0542 [Pseudomonas aeruginosa PAK]|nr:hypothetical protein Y880_0542 [Pseudomonas aeruginosa PAK]
MFGLVDSFTEGKKERPGELTEGELKIALSDLLKEYKYI